MKFRDFLEKWGLGSLKISLGFLEGEFKPQDPDRYAAWDMYVELLTRVTTQYLAPDEGDETTALSSVHQLFPLTREILRKHGSGAGKFAMIAIPVLNQVIRPFTAKWHRLSLAKAFDDAGQRQRFRQELAELQTVLSAYTRALGALANIEEDLAALEKSSRK